MSIIAQTREIYNHLCDEKSKRIFENRLLYSLTDDYDFVNNIVKLSFEESIIEEYNNKMNAYFKKYNNKNIIIYGAGFTGKIFAATYDNFINILAFCDSDAKKHGSEINGYKIISPEQLRQESKDTNIVIAVYGEKVISEIIEKLINMGLKKESILMSQAIRTETLFYCNSILEKQYFDTEIMMSAFPEDEVFIDGGCCDCLTAMRFAKICGNKYKKIIAFEPDPRQYPICEENSKSIFNTTVHPYALWNKNTELTFDNSGMPGGAYISDNAKGNAVTIKTVKLDDILDGDKATFIKLDIEGAELNALKGAEQTILKYRPKLAICLYHKPEDIWEIPAYILSLHDDYKLYIRHYTFRDSGTILYAI